MAGDKKFRAAIHKSLLGGGRTALRQREAPPGGFPCGGIMERRE